MAVDPGREKCGVAVMDRERGVLRQSIVPTANLTECVEAFVKVNGCRAVVLGNQTFSTQTRHLLESLLEQKKIDEIISVDEHGSTEAARDRYWKAFPPTGWRRFLPRGLLVPPCAVDDFAAIILGERYFGKKS